MNEFGSTANAEMVSDALGDLLQAFGSVVGIIPEASILTVANPVFPDGKTYPLVLTNRQIRLIQWALRRAGTSNKNECLIAAAPDLLSSLKEMVGDLLSHATFGLNDHEIAMLNRAEAAIAKAHGN